MREPARHEPGPGRSTAAAAFNELTKGIAQRNEEVHRAARKLRNVREQEKQARRRKQDLQ